MARRSGTKCGLGLCQFGFLKGEIGCLVIASESGIDFNQFGDRFSRIDGLILNDEQSLDDAWRQCCDANRRGTRFNPSGRLKQGRSFRPG
jgi:hypothetical protein